MKLFLPVFFVFLSMSIFAQLPFLLKDINSTMFSDSDPSQFTEFNNKTYFIATNSLYGEEIWVSNGTPSTTTVFIDIVPGSNSSNPFILGVHIDKLFFTTSGQNGEELWVTDGTVSGTIRLNNPISTNSFNAGVRVLQSNSNYLYFTARNEVNGTELWATNGTVTGTNMLEDFELEINDEEGDFGTSIIVNEDLYFTFTSTIPKTDLYKVTTTGILNLTGGVQNQNQYIIIRLINYENRLYFTYNDLIHGNELWTSDGTVAGTLMAFDFTVGSSSTYPDNFFVTPNGFIFSDGNYNLFKTSGSLESIVNLQTQIEPGSEYLTYNQKVYFNGRSSFNDPNGNELRSFNEFFTGSSMVKDINPGPSSGGLKKMIVVNNSIFGIGYSSDTGAELWLSNGTEENTFLVKDIYTGTNNGFIGNLVAYNDKAYFTARTAFNSFFLYESDGSENGTNQLFPIDATNFSNPLGVNAPTITPPYMRLCDNKLYMVADFHSSTVGKEPYVLDKSLMIDQNGNTVSTIEVTICEGQSYSFNGNTYFYSGNYYDTLLASNGNDSIILTKLNVLQASSSQQYVSICANENYWIGQSNYTEAGNYIDTLISSSGCDSIVYTILTVFPSYLETRDIELCENSFYQVGENIYSEGGVFIDSLFNVHGCDSIIISSITISPTYFNVINYTLCNGSVFSFQGVDYETDVDLFNNFQSVYGCDSNVAVSIRFQNEIIYYNYQTICEGSSYNINGNSYTLAGQYVDLFTAQGGCDSLVYTFLTVDPYNYIPITASFCEGSSYEIAGNIFYEAGNYVVLNQNSNGCTDYYDIQLSSNSPTYFDNYQIICQGETYSINGNNYSQPGIYFDTLIGITTCDSIVTTTIQLIPISNYQNTQTICQGEFYSINSNTYSTEGTYIDTLQAISGCDSVVTTILTINPIILNQNNQTICEGAFIEVNGNMYDSPGNYSDTLVSSLGCDSIVITTVSIIPIVSSSNNIIICEGETYLFNDTIYSSEGIYADTLVSHLNCDSVVYTNLSFYTENFNQNVSISSDFITLSSLENNASYQWIDCNNNNVFIGGATNQSFTATQNGSYAVILTSATCNVQDTSACFNINNVGVESLDASIVVTAYPNPASETITIETSALSNKTIRIYDAIGKLVFEGAMNDSKMHVSCSTWSAGMYTIELTTNEHTYKHKLIKD